MIKTFTKFWFFKGIVQNVFLKTFLLCIRFFKNQQKDYLIESYQYPNQLPSNSLTVIFLLDKSNT